VGNVRLGEATEAPRQRVVERKERARDLDFRTEVKKLRASRLFERWSQAPLQERDLIHVYSALGVFDHTPAQAKRRKLEDLKGSAKKAEDGDIELLLENVEMTFPGLFREPQHGRNRK
jgi:hypothetical protein